MENRGHAPSWEMETSLGGWRSELHVPIFIPASQSRVFYVINRSILTGVLWVVLTGHQSSRKLS